MNDDESANGSAAQALALEPEESLGVIVTGGGEVLEYEVSVQLP